VEIAAPFDYVVAWHSLKACLRSLYKKLLIPKSKVYLFKSFLFVMSEIKAPRGAAISCKNWKQEGFLRLLMNNLENARKTGELIIYGGSGKAARNWNCFNAIVKALEKSRKRMRLC
jgi:urocanate hydratase (EC 4.2.1.49)